MLPHGKDAHGWAIVGNLKINGRFGFQSWDSQLSLSVSDQQVIDKYLRHQPKKKMSHIAKMFGKGKLIEVIYDQVLGELV